MKLLQFWEGGEARVGTLLLTEDTRCWRGGGALLGEPGAKSPEAVALTNIYSLPVILKRKTTGKKDQLLFFCPKQIFGVEWEERGSYPCFVGFRLTDVS